MNLRNEWFQSELQKSEESVSHRPLEEEYSFYQAVTSGDIDRVQKIVERIFLPTLMVWVSSLQTL